MRLAVFLLPLLVTAAGAAPRDDLLAADKAFSDLSVAKGSNAAFLAYAADDVRLFGSGNQPPIYGKNAMTKRFAASGNGDPGKNTLSWTPLHAASSDDGTVGWTDGTWLFLGAPDHKGMRPKVTGHYLTVWKRDAQGRWKVEADMGTVDKPAK